MTVKSSPAQLANKKQYYEENREDILAYSAAYHRAHREERAVNDATRYNAHREEKVAYQREYNASVRKPRRRDRQNFLTLMKAGVGCADCGGVELLHFHHRDKSTKSFSVSRETLLPWSELMTEIWKCDVLCGSCHAKRHRAEDRCLVN